MENKSAIHNRTFLKKSNIYLSCRFVWVFDLFYASPRPSAGVGFFNLYGISQV